MVIKFDAKHWQVNIFYLCLVLTPFLSYVELTNIFSGQILVMDSSELFFIKASKDVLLILCLFIGFFSWRYRQLDISIISFLIMVISIVLSIVLTSAISPLEQTASGIRWLIPFLVFFFLKKFDLKFYINLTRLMELVLLIGLALQVYQLFFMEGIYGQFASGLSLRNPGIFLLPSSMACYTMVTLLFTFYFEESQFRKKLIYFLSLCSVILTSSGSGIISFIFFSITLYLIKKKLTILLPFGGLLLIYLFSFLPVLSGRDNIFESMYGRFDILSDAIYQDNIIFSTKFGIGTNTFVSIAKSSNNIHNSIIADSQISASIINLGFLFCIVFIYEFFIKPIFSFGKDFYLYCTVFAPFYFSIVLFELFPVNILMFLIFSYLVEYAKSNKR